MSQKNDRNNFILPAIIIAVFAIGIYVYKEQSQPTVLSASNNAAPKTTPSSNNAAVTYPKEFFIPLGYGAFASSPTDWTDVGGVQVTLDTWQYPRLKQTQLEVSVYSPNGNQTVWVRLRNYDGWSYPEMSMNGTGPQLLTTNLTLSPGPKTYYLQVKTQLGYPVQIYQARLHLNLY